MGKTLRELFQDKDSYKFGVDYSEVKSNTKTLVDQELNGIRTSSKVELGNPNIYGVETIRITKRGTEMLDTMKSDRGVDQGIAGLLSGPIQNAKQKANNIKYKLLGFPAPFNPSNVVTIGSTQGAYTGTPLGFLPTPPFIFTKSDSAAAIAGNLASSLTGIPWGPGNEQDTMVNIGGIKDKFGGTEIGKLLKASLGGNPKTVGKELVGNGIQLVKDKLREGLFGSGDLRDNDAGKSSDFTAYGSGTKKYSYVQKNLGNTINNGGDFTADEFKKKYPLLEKVSPIYGVDRKGSVFPPKPAGEFGNSEYGFKAYSSKPQSKYSPEKDSNYVASLNNDDSKKTIYGWYGMNNTNNSNVKNQVSDTYNQILDTDTYKLDKTKAFPSIDGKDTEAGKNDFIPIWIKKFGGEYPVFFRAIITGLTETVSPSWNSSNFVGNPYNFYTFQNIERSTSFNLSVYCLNKDELNSMWNRIQNLTKLAYPTIGAQYADPPLIEFRIGDIYNNTAGFIESLTYTIPENSTWEIDGESGYLPKIVDIALTIKFIENVGVEDKPYGFVVKAKDTKTSPLAVETKPVITF
jgi:hypothetical protein